MNLLLFSLLLTIIFIYKGSANPVLISSISSEVRSADLSNNCPLGYSQPAGSNWDKCYKVFANTLSQAEAAARCTYDNATLSSVANSFVNSYLYMLASQIEATSLWLGVECFDRASQCVNSDGTPFTYDSFYPGQPSLTDFCVYMSVVGRDSHMWSSFDCEQTFQFACEVPIVNPYPTTTVLPATKSQKSCPGGYSEFQGTCYSKIYSFIGMTHDSLAQECDQISGGNVASIPSQEVNTFLLHLPSDCPSQYNVLFGLKCINVTFNGDTSSCIWDDETPFDYDNFLEDEPRKSVTGPRCPYMVEGIWYGEYDCQMAVSCGICQAPLN